MEKDIENRPMDKVEGEEGERERKFVRKRIQINIIWNKKGGITTAMEEMIP